MAGSEVAADWAWISKDLASGIGYTVLKVSTGAIDFGSISGDYEPGAPKSTTTPDAPDAPPWVTYGPGDGGRDGVLMSVSVRDPWTDRDHTGRPVWPQRLLVMRYADLAAADASFQTIWAAVQHAQVPAPNGAPLPVTVAAQSPDDLIAVIEENFESLAAIAAALLERPVAIADASHLPREHRLALLDAVTALLPYGYRADLSASSSVNNTVKHRIRLVFADFPNGDQQVMSLLGQGNEPHGDLGQRYLATLRDKRKQNGIRPLIRHLWDIREEDGQRPCSFRRPAFALAALHDLDFLGGIRDALGKGLVPPEQILKFFADPDSPAMWERFDVHRRDNAVRSLRAASGEAATTVLVNYWPAIGGDVVRCANGDLDAGSVEIATWCLHSIGQADPRLEDRVLADLLVPERLKPEAGDRRIGMLVELLRQRRVPAPGAFPHTCGYLRFGNSADWQARLILELLTIELSAGMQGDRALGWVGWLCRSPFTESPDWKRPEWINALDFMDSGSPDAGQGRERAVPPLRALIQRDRQATPRGNCWSAVFLRLGQRARCLAELLEAVSWQLMELAATLPADDQSPLATTFRAELQPSAPLITPTTLARVDVLRVLLRGAPSAALLDLDDRRLDDYLGALHEALRGEAVRPRAAELERRFLRHGLTGTAATGRLSHGGVRLLNAWAGDRDRQDGLAGYIATLAPEVQPVDVQLSQKYWAILGEYPELADYAVAGQLITATDWTVRNPSVAFRRDDTGEAVTTTRLARACYEASCAGRHVDGIIRTLASAGAAEIAPRRLDEVLREFQGLLYLFLLPDHPDARAESEQVLFDCWQLILTGALGSGYAARFGDYLYNRLRDEFSTRDSLLKALFPGRGKGGAARTGWLRRVLRWLIRTIFRRQPKQQQPPAAAGGGATWRDGSQGPQRKAAHADRA
jgi:hypothetical protein